MSTDAQTATEPAVAPDPGKPDAILYPESARVGKSGVARLQSIQDRFGPVLGGSKVHNIRVIGFGYMAVLDPQGVAYSHYDWHDQRDGTFYGYRKADES
jgi:hypothetical protein